MNNFEIQNYYQNEAKFNGFHSRNNLNKIKDGSFVTYLNECKSIETPLMTFYVNGDNVTYLNSSGVAYIPIEILKFIDVKNITTNIYRTHWA